MLRVLPQASHIRNLLSQPFIKYCLLTVQSQPQELSIHENFEFQMDNQFLKQESLLEKSSKLSEKDMTGLLSYSFEFTPQSINNNELLDLNKIRRILHSLVTGIDTINLSTPQLIIISGNLHKFSIKAIKDSGTYDHNIIKSLFTLSKNNYLPAKDLISSFYDLLSSPELISSLNFENLTNMLLLLNDILKLPSISKDSKFSKNNLYMIIEALQKQTQKLIEGSHPHEYEFYFFLPKILFCFVQLEPKNKWFLNKLLSNILYCDIASFEELEVTSLLYTIIKMEKKLHILTDEIKGSLYGGFQDIYSQLQEIITQRIASKTLSYKRVPYILYCLSMIGNCSKSTLSGLTNIFLTNLDKYSVNEVCTVMYCMWRIPELDFQNKNIIGIIDLYFNASNENYSFLSDTNLYTAFLGVRKPMKSELEPKQKQKIEQFLNRLLQIFKEKFESLTVESKIRILYEVTHTHKMIERKTFLEKYTTFFLTLDLTSLNNHDLITVGYLMKKYLQFNQEHFDFWNKYFECLVKRKWHSKIEENRLKLIFTNLKDLISQDNPTMLKNANLKKKWLEKIDHYYKVCFTQENMKRTRS